MLVESGILQPGVEKANAAPGLEVIVPFTTPRLTQAALDAAGRMLSGLSGHVRVICVQTVPTGASLEQPPISTAHMERCLRALRTECAVRAEIVISREDASMLESVLPRGEPLVIASKRRPWRTREEKLARVCALKGREVILIHIG